MKVKFYLVMAIAAFLMSNCSQDEPLVQTKNNTNTLTAFIENASRSSVTDGGVFKWNENDAIAVGNADGGYTKFVYGNETFTAGTSITPKGYAIYPFSDEYASLPETGLPIIELAETYEYGSTNAPMLATIEEGATSLNFKHLAGLMRFRVKGVPATATDFTLTAAGKDITGEFTPIASNSETTIQAGTTGVNNKVKITFTEVKEVMTFYVPMPVGEYTSLKVAIGGKELNSAPGVINVITRGKLLLMPTMVFENGELVKEDVNNVSLIEDEVISLEVEGNEKVVVEIADGATATLNLAAPENSALTISDGSENDTESSTTSAGTLNVAAPNVSSLNINAPTLTVKLTSGSYDKVEALTAQQTLIIGEGVKIGELVLNGGNVKLEGDLELTSPLVIKNGITTTIDLNGHTMSQEKECTASYQMIDNKGNLTITGGGKISFKDTSAGDPSFGWGSYTIRNEGTLVVEDAIIEHLGEQNQGSVKHMYCAIFQYSGSTTINGGTISTPTYRSVRLWKGDMTINGGNFEGQVWVQSVDDSANLTITGGTFAPRGVDGSSVFIGNRTESNVVHNVNFNVTGGTFTTKVGFNDQSAIIGGISGGTFSDFSFIKLLAETSSIKMGADITLSAMATIPTGKTITLDLNGHTLSGVSETEGASAVIENKGDLTIMSSVEGGVITSKSLNPDTNWGGDGQIEYPTYANNTINNKGALKILSGTIENTTAAGGATYAIDSYAGSTIEIEGGNIINENNVAVRLFAGGNIGMTVTGGEITGTRAVWMQLPSGASSTVKPEVKLDILGGVLTSNDETYNLAVYIYSYGQSAENVSISVKNDAVINGNIAINGSAGNTMKEAAAVVTGGVFNGEYGIYTYSEGHDNVISITGGTFKTNYSESYVDEGYSFVEENGTYTVKKN